MAIQWWRKTRHRLSAVLLLFSSSSSSSSSSEKRKIKTNSNVIYPRSHSWMLSPERGLHYSLSLSLTLVWLRSVNIGSSVPISTWLPVNRCEKDLGQWTRFIRVTRKWSLSFSPTRCVLICMSHLFYVSFSRISNRDKDGVLMAENTLDQATRFPPTRFNPFSARPIRETIDWNLGFVTRTAISGSSLHQSQVAAAFFLLLLKKKTGTLV